MVAVVNKPKAIGTRAESKVVKELRDAGLSAIRVVMKGAHDEGDIHIFEPTGRIRYVLEVKAGKQTKSVTRKQKEDWLRETKVEADNVTQTQKYYATGFLVIAKFGTSPRNFEVWSSSGQMFFYLDEFARYVKEGICGEKH